MIPSTGERALICGQTGSGKTAFACWLLAQIETTPFILYDTKIEPKFDALPGSRRVYSQAGVEEALNDEAVDYVIFQPPEELLVDPKALDAELLWTHYNRYQGVGAYIDEVTSFNSHAGKTEQGLLSMLSRGRSKAITLIMSTQRPKGLSRYCLTEAQHFYMFALTDREDAKRFDDFLESYSKMPRLIVGEHKFYYKRIGVPGAPDLFNPVPVDDNSQIGYVDIPSPQAEEGVEGSLSEDAGASDNRGLVWL